MTESSNQQHLDEILLNKEAWDAKPALQEEYYRFFRKIASKMSLEVGHPDRRVVELGSGMGRLADVISDVIKTDLWENPWIDKVCSAYQLDFEDASISDLILIDVFHHLETPAAFFKEAGRCLRPGGRVHIFDPFISLFSWPIYGLAHHEPVGRARDINWSDKAPDSPGYYAAQGNASFIFFRNASETPFPGFKVEFRDRLACWTYLLSGGFSKPALYPASMKSLLQGLDKILDVCPDVFAGRCHIVLEKID